MIRYLRYEYQYRAAVGALATATSLYRGTTVPAWSAIKKGKSSCCTIRKGMKDSSAVIVAMPSAAFTQTPATCPTRRSVSGYDTAAR